MPLLDRSLPVHPTWVFAALLTALVLLLVALPPFVPDAARVALYTAFSPVCHQMEARSFQVDGHAFAVCHRCTGIFAGLLAGTLAWPFVRAHEASLTRHAALLLVLSLVPTALDWLLGVTGVLANTPVSRSLTGALFGAMAGVYLSRGFARMGEPPVARASARSLPSSYPPG